MKKKYIRPSVEVVVGKLEENVLFSVNNTLGGSGAYAPGKKGDSEWEEEEEW